MILPLLLGLHLARAQSVIVPGALWTDTSGNAIQAHGAGILKVGSTFYWFGEDKSLNSVLFKAVSCYNPNFQSTDLVNWSRQNDALTPISGTMISTSNVVERPKGPCSLLVHTLSINRIRIFIRSVSSFVQQEGGATNLGLSKTPTVMTPLLRTPNTSCGSIPTPRSKSVHSPHPPALFCAAATTSANPDIATLRATTRSYGAAMVGVATANSPCGPYAYKGSWKPLGADSRDEGLFQDGAQPSSAILLLTVPTTLNLRPCFSPLDDSAQTAYLLYASDNNQDFKITQLDADYYNVTTLASELAGATLEAPGIVKRDSVYYLIASHTSGWDPNPNKWFSASSLAGPWSAQADIAPGARAHVLLAERVRPPLGANAIYMGDRWRSDLLGSSSYIGTRSTGPAARRSWCTRTSGAWTSPQVGTYSVASGTSYEAESGTISGSATILSDASFSGGEAVGYLGNGGSVTITVQGRGAAQWVALYFANGDATWRNTTVRRVVNGGAAVIVQQPDTGGGNVIISVPVQLRLTAGANAITFSAGQSNYAADLDRIIVY
ncbi:hypothetical protein A0H81_04432 [Grifola frondosa]|uniref:CBM6 domain-containing protein n=1 Tax=Grifola frondosa TaxID=5627 RepID=A0A1C7MEB9_GRIFR|nr:hypothetical protein A0H81_04432 [Grifola frondosa]